MDSPFFAAENIQALARRIEAEVRKTTRSEYTFDVPPQKMADRMADLAEAHPHLLEPRYGARELNAMLVKQAVEALTTDGADQYMIGLLKSDRKTRGLHRSDEDETLAPAATLVSPYAADFKRLIEEEQRVKAAVLEGDPLQRDGGYRRLHRGSRMTDDFLSTFRVG